MKTEERHKIRIAMIDDHPLFRAGVKQILSMEENFEVVAEGEDGSEAVDLMRQYQPDIILMDMQMPKVNGIEATETLLQSFPNAKVLILSIYEEETYVSSVLRAGAVGYLLKEMKATKLIEAIKMTAAGGMYIHPKVAPYVLKEYRDLWQKQQAQQAATAYQVVEYCRPLHLLTVRECEILQLLVDGENNKGMAESLYISEKTVKNHISRILRKLKVKDRTQAVVVAMKRGYVLVRDD